jgi:agmatine deiminase
MPFVVDGACRANFRRRHSSAIIWSQRPGINSPAFPEFVLHATGCVSPGHLHMVVSFMEPSPAAADLLPHFRWPAEWEDHVCTWAAWPVREETWPGIFDRIPPAFANFVGQMARFEPVKILLGDPSVGDAAQSAVWEACDRLASRHVVEFVDIPVNDSWCRDHGPVFLTGLPESPYAGQSLIVDWGYNAWGGKYPPWDLDCQVAGRIAELLQIPRARPNLVLEGGAIEGNGAGTILTTASCLTDVHRNPHATQASMDDALRLWMQARQVVWLPGGGIEGDDTDGHIDQSARFVSHAKVLAASPWNDDAPEATLLRENLAVLREAKTADGEALHVVELALPQPKYQQEARLPASYCNFVFANGAVIVPTFRDAADDRALQTLQDCFPDHTVVGVDALDLVWGLGAFHCLTQQQPAAGVPSHSTLQTG